VSSVIARDSEQVTFELFGSSDAKRRHCITSWRLPIAAAFAFFAVRFPASSRRKSRSPERRQPGRRSAGYLANDPRRSAGEPALASVWLELLLNRHPRRIRTQHLVPSCFAMALSTAQGRSQQRDGPRVVAALKVMKGGSHLNERLQERLFRSRAVSQTDSQCSCASKYAPESKQTKTFRNSPRIQLSV
jgi:hypothetical protein